MHGEDNQMSLIPLDYRTDNQRFIDEILEEAMNTLVQAQYYYCQKSGQWAVNCPETPTKKFQSPNSNQDHMLILDKDCPCGVGTCAVLTSNMPKNSGRKFYNCPLQVPFLRKETRRKSNFKSSRSEKKSGKDLGTNKYDRTKFNENHA
ncbi:hypothetical protein Scep_024069 [Stephania cephalantha]|uniref:GRF-type domain-containing protein n=1 Tax=Stephania cephalantha TaxID=152367 RepID=A0AAP0EWI1_9MAGN